MKVTIIKLLFVVWSAAHLSDFILKKKRLARDPVSDPDHQWGGEKYRKVCYIGGR